MTEDEKNKHTNEEEQASEERLHDEENERNQEEESGEDANEAVGEAQKDHYTKEEVAQKLAVEKERRLRLMADFDNYKKRVESEKAMFGAIANRGIIQEILEVHDDLQLAMNDEELDLDRAKESITNAQEKIKGLVKNAGIEALEVKAGDDFNKETMEAITTVPDKANKGKVIAVISSAFKYVGQEGVLKPAKVVVGK